MLKRAVLKFLKHLFKIYPSSCIFLKTKRLKINIGALTKNATMSCLPKIGLAVLKRKGERWNITFGMKKFATDVFHYHDEF